MKDPREWDGNGVPYKLRWTPVRVLVTVSVVLLIAAAALAQCSGWKP